MQSPKYTECRIGKTLPITVCGRSWANLEKKFRNCSLAGSDGQTVVSMLPTHGKPCEIQASIIFLYNYPLFYCSRCLIVYKRNLYTLI